MESEAACSPNYVCDDWSACQQGLKTRVCTDTQCEKKDVTERSFCADKCTPNVQCDKWGPCIYTEKTDSVINGEIGFGGYHTRACRDLNKCIASFLQEGPCEENYKLQLSPAVLCGQKILAVIDPASDRKIANIDLEGWEKEGKFNLAFVQGDKKYCPSCYNAIKDSDEESIDCGGSCRSCRVETRFLSYLTITFLWIGSLIFIFLSFNQYFKLKKPQSIFVEQ
jgi:hypothetical protein